MRNPSDDFTLHGTRYRCVNETAIVRTSVPNMPNLCRLLYASPDVGALLHFALPLEELRKKRIFGSNLFANISDPIGLTLSLKRLGSKCSCSGS